MDVIYYLDRIRGWDFIMRQWVKKIKKEHNFKFLFTIYLGFIIIFTSLFLPWFAIRGTLPPPGEEYIKKEDSIFDKGILGIDILLRNRERGGERLTIMAWFSLILLVIISFLLPTIFYGDPKWLLATGFISLLLQGIIFTSAIPFTLACAYGYPLIGIHIALVGGIVTVICSQIIKKWNRSKTESEKVK
jgi:glycopeptide antibiotics resistance protein